MMNKEDLKEFGQAPAPNEIEITATMPTLKQLTYYKEAWINAAIQSGIIEILFDVGIYLAEGDQERYRHSVWVAPDRFVINDQLTIHYKKTQTERFGVRHFNSTPWGLFETVTLTSGGEKGFELLKSVYLARIKRGELNQNMTHFDQFKVEWENESYIIPRAWEKAIRDLVPLIETAKEKLVEDADTKERDKLIKLLNLR